MLKRTLSGIGFGAIMLMALLLNKYFFGIIMALALVGMMYEFLRMTMGNKYRYSQILSILTGLTLFIMVFSLKAFQMPVMYATLTFVPAFLMMVNGLYVKDKSCFDKFANLYVAILYIAVPWTLMNYAVFNSAGEFSGLILLSFFVIIWASDCGAYLFGITLGQKYGKKLFPSISPKKSWIGFWGGMLLAIVAGVLLSIFEMLPLNLMHAIILSIIIHCIGVYGDLIESQWKRHYQVKDSGNIIPGHGGLLDRFDSALMAIPAGVIYLIFLNLLLK